MFIISATIFALSGVYAVFGNLAVYILLVRHGVSVSFVWAGTPGYLLRKCHESGQGSLARFSFSTQVALMVCVLSGFFLFASARPGG